MPMHSEQQPLVFAKRSDDLVAALGGAWMVAGLFLDGWAHRNQKPETFFTPWHGVLYSGFVASAVWLLKVVRSHQRPGSSIRQAIPVGYGFRSLGVAIFGVGAIGDLIWHQVFGIEVNIEALLSPTHLVLLSGGLLMASGPIVSTIRREGANQRASWSSTGAVIGSVAFILCVLQFFFMYLSPYDYGKYNYQYVEATQQSRWLGNEVLIDGIGSAILFSILVALALNFIVRTVRVPRGAFLMVLLLPAVLQTLLTSFATAHRLLGPAVAAVVAETTWSWLRTRLPSVALVSGWVGLLTLITNYGILLGTAMAEELSWSVHLWTGLPVLAGLLAALLTVVTQMPTSSTPITKFM
jgi:hypothetical protein